MTESRGNWGTGGTGELKKLGEPLGELGEPLGELGEPLGELGEPLGELGEPLGEFLFIDMFYEVLKIELQK